MKKGPSQRQLKVGEEIRHLLSEVFAREDFYLFDENGNHTGETMNVTFSEVRVSPDLHNATVYALPLGGKNKERIISSLKLYAPQIRSMIARKMRLRHFPILNFRPDESFEEAHKIESLLNHPDVRRDLENQEV